ncbi:MAG: dihydroorotate dehydrogenase electron transfer subunit [Lentisphaerae bacterium]|jgi:dihydroorotate dehydrogenase electron transfer subunit|nr:dihydroorotate dehydrogenase electron transfer subunit [Lentisphaerota bacterium]
MPEQHQISASILRNQHLQGEYYQLDMEAAAIARAAQPGQFIHVQLPGMPANILRRPFSIFDVNPEDGRLSIIYKVVGKGTEHIASLDFTTKLDILGPLGQGFSPLPSDIPSIIVGGGYGCAATFLLAKRAPVKPTVLLGAHTLEDVLLQDAYQSLGCRVLVTTDDGSAGTKGLVTELLERVLDENPKSWIAACGPTAMLKVVSMIADSRKLDAEISLDRVMCCGMGACFACVIKRKADTPEKWAYARACADGPVFKANEIWWE